MNILTVVNKNNFMIQAHLQYSNLFDTLHKLYASALLDSYRVELHPSFTCCSTEHNGIATAPTTMRVEFHLQVGYQVDESKTLCPILLILNGAVVKVDDTGYQVSRTGDIISQWKLNDGDC